jgi:hypothetical protein
VQHRRTLKTLRRVQSPRALRISHEKVRPKWLTLLPSKKSSFRFLQVATPERRMHGTPGLWQQRFWLPLYLSGPAWWKKRIKIGFATIHGDEPAGCIAFNRFLFA